MITFRRVKFKTPMTPATIGNYEHGANLSGAQTFQFLKITGMRETSKGMRQVRLLGEGIQRKRGTVRSN